jgi:hypothetical protein
MDQMVSLAEAAMMAHSHLSPGVHPEDFMALHYTFQFSPIERTLTQFATPGRKKDSPDTYFPSQGRVLIAFSANTILAI